MVKIIYQQVTEDGKFVLGLEGLSSDTKPTGGVIADGSTFKETNTDAVYYLDTTWKLAKAGQLKELPTVSAGDNGKVMKVAEGAWGLGTDEAGSGSELPPYDSEDEGRVLSVDKEGDLEWVTPSGGGAEKFVVTLTADDSGAETVWTADKTIEEIIAADAAGQIVVAKYPFYGMPADIPLLTAGTISDDEVETSMAAFGAIIAAEHNSLMSIAISAQGSNGDEWTVEAENIEIPNAPLKVTMTFDDPSDPTAFVGDKTYGEVFTAASAGIPCSIVWSAGGSDVAIPLVTAVSSSGTIVLYFYDTDSSSITSIQGTSSDNVTVAIS